MIYYLHNSQTGRIQQSTKLEYFSDPDRAAFRKMLRMRWFDRDVFASSGTSRYRISYS